MCGQYQANVSGSHLSYASNEATTQGATFAANKIRATPTPTTSPTTAPTTSPTTAPTSTGTCVRSSTYSHVLAGRALNVFGGAYARGTNTFLGPVSTFNVISLRQTGTNIWALVSSR